MRAEEEEEPNWFARWEEDLPSPEELMPLSQTLITPGLALAFNIPTPNCNPNGPYQHHHASDFDSPDLGGGGSGADEPARTLKRPRLVWTPQLHKRFVDAVAHIGIKNAVPKTIMQLMSVDGLTRENVASHLQKYRLYLRRMQGLTSPSSSSASAAVDAATDQLFAASPVPHHFLCRGGSDRLVPFIAVTETQHQHHHHMAAAHQQQYYHHRHIGDFRSPPGGGGRGFDHGYLTRAPPKPGMHRIAGLGGVGLVDPSTPLPPPVPCLEDPKSEIGGGRRVLTLFPTGED